ncbi:uncharacterized protein BO87DRAFT_320588, partial [Aspergillus neoniger CBS 115656]
DSGFRPELSMRLVCTSPRWINILTTASYPRSAAQGNGVWLAQSGKSTSTSCRARRSFTTSSNPLPAA